jgi:hypothetical protein
MGFASQNRKRRGDLGDRGAHVRRCGAALVPGVVGVAGVGVGDGEAEVAFTQVKVVCRIQWVLICWGADPRKVVADADPQAS